MWVVVCLAGWLLLFALVKTFQPDGPFAIRRAFLAASVIWGIATAVSTELLSFFHAITPGMIVLFWAILDLALIAVCAAAYRNVRAALRLALPDLRDGWLILGLTAVFVAATGVIALIGAPNNVDAMTYHLPRVMHWIQNQSVAHYATYNQRQLYEGPWSEFAIMHLQLLSGSDQFSNMVQWFSMLGATLGVSLLAARLGLDRRGQIFAALFTATLPMGILQSQTNQTDYVVSFWIVCLAYYTMTLTEQTEYREGLPGFAASLGLAILTKGTGYVFGLPFVIWAGLALVRRHGWGVWKPGLAICVVVIGLNLPQMIRNAEIFPSPLGPVGYYANQAFGFAPIVSMLIRDTVIHFHPPTPAVRDAELSVLQNIHQMLGLSISDPQLSMEPFNLPLLRSQFTYNENYAGSPLHLVAIWAAMGIALARPSLRRRPGWRLWLGMLIASVGLFVALFKWQPWITRLQLPLFVLGAPIAAGVIAGAERPGATNFAAVILAATSLPFLLINPGHPVILLPDNIQRGIFGSGFRERFSIFDERFDQIGSSAPIRPQGYVAAASFIESQGCSRVGLIIDYNGYEYPLWLALSRAHPPVRIEAIATSSPPHQPVGPVNTAFSPCIVLMINQDEPPDEVTTNGRVFTRALATGTIIVYTPRP